MVAEGRQHMESNTGTSRTLPEQGYSLHVSPECRDVLLHPREGHQLVVQTHVARGFVRVQVEESEQTLKRTVKGFQICFLVPRGQNFCFHKRKLLTAVMMIMVSDNEEGKISHYS